MRAALTLLARVALGAAILLPACAHNRDDDLDIEEIVGEEDPTLEALEQAFLALREGAHDDARLWLEEATATFDDLALEGSSLEKAFASDVHKPYRGRPHERVLASVVLAALDIERGRCDLALPSLKNAAWLDARADPAETTDVPLVPVLTLRCLKQVGASGADLERARADLRSALRLTAAEHRAGELETMAAADDLALALDGDGPAVRADGAAGERAVVVPATAGRTFSGRLEETKVSPTAIVIHLGKQRPAPARASSGLVVWSSTHQATTVQGRPFEEVLGERAELRRGSLAEGSRLLHGGLADVTATVDAGRRAGKIDSKAALAQLLSGGLVATAGMGLTAVGAATDARADLRYVSTLFERVVLLGERPIARRQLHRGRHRRACAAGAGAPGAACASSRSMKSPGVACGWR